LPPADLRPGGLPLLLVAEPKFPEAARKARLVGYAVVALSVGADGVPSVDSATGSNVLLAQAARRAALESRFSAGPEHSRCATLVFHFALRPEVSEEPAVLFSVVSPHEFLTTAAEFPLRPVDGCPQPKACFIESSFGSTTVCEKALRLLPLR
jgi:hypothetical protein